MSTECLEDFSGGVFWDVAFDGDTVAKPCRAVDERFRYVRQNLCESQIVYSKQIHFCKFITMPLVVSSNNIATSYFTVCLAQVFDSVFPSLVQW